MKWTLPDVIQQPYSHHASFLPKFTKIIVVLDLFCYVKEETEGDKGVNNSCILCACCKDRCCTCFVL